MNLENKKGFTLVESAIVIVIVGMLVGGILLGNDLIASFKIRSQISQIERYTVAAYTFKSKYNALPGDMKASEVVAAGFATIPTRAGTRAEGDGNSLLEGIYSGGVRRFLVHGETAWFWVDLSANSGLIEGNFKSATATPTVDDGFWYANGSPNLSKILPRAKVGDTNFITAYSLATDYHCFVISKITGMAGAGNPGNSTNELAMTPQQAYAIDSKMDDGLPQVGRVTARYLEWDIHWDRLTWAAGGDVEGATGTAATPASETTCFDNSNVSGATQKYSLSTDGGGRLNCALTFRFQ